MTYMNRREIVRLGLAAPFLIAAARQGSAAELAGTKLRIATWGGSWRDSIDANVAKVVADQGAELEYLLGNPDDNLAQLIAAKRQGEVPFDVMEGLPHITIPMAEAGLIAPLDYNGMPNAAAAPEWARQENEIVSVFTEDGVVYNRDKFKEEGIEPPTTYRDLANPKLAGHVAFPDIGNAQHWNAIVGMAYENGGSEADLSGAVEMINEIKPSYFFAASTELATRFGAGDIWAAAWHAGWAVRLRRQDVPLAVAYTPFGDKRGALWPVPAYIVADTPNLAGAQAFVDALMSPEGQFAHGSATGSVPVDSSARAKIAEDELSDELLMLSDEEVANLHRIDWDKLDIDAWRSTWEREVTR